MVVQVQLANDGAAKVSLKGTEHGIAVERCVQAALGDKAFPGGPLQVIHVLKQPAAQSQPAEPRL